MDTLIAKGLLSDQDTRILDRKQGRKQAGGSDVMCSLQYPKGLGSTVSELDVSQATCVVAKTKFSMLVDDVISRLPSLCGGDLQHVVLFGIEASRSDTLSFHEYFRNGSKQTYVCVVSECVCVGV